MDIKRNSGKGLVPTMTHEFATNMDKCINGVAKGLPKKENSAGCPHKPAFEARNFFRTLRCAVSMFSQKKIHTSGLGIRNDDDVCQKSITAFNSLAALLCACNDHISRDKMADIWKIMCDASSPRPVPFYGKFRGYGFMLAALVLLHSGVSTAQCTDVLWMSYEQTKRNKEQSLVFFREFSMQKWATPSCLAVAEKGVPANIGANAGVQMDDDVQMSGTGIRNLSRPRSQRKNTCQNDGRCTKTGSTRDPRATFCVGSNSGVAIGYTGTIKVNKKFQEVLKRISSDPNQAGSFMTQDTAEDHDRYHVTNIDSSDENSMDDGDIIPSPTTPNNFEDFPSGCGIFGNTDVFGDETENSLLSTPQENWGEFLGLISEPF